MMMELMRTKSNLREVVPYLTNPQAVSAIVASMLLPNLAALFAAIMLSA